MVKYPSEQELIPDIKAFIQGTGEPGQMVLEEVPSPWGRPDILITRADEPFDGKMIPLGRSDLSVASLILKAGSLTRNGIARRYGSSEKSLSPIIERLLSRGLALDRCGTISIVDTPHIIEKITAIEVKTRDWISGIRQAKRYKTFANEVILFLGKKIRGMDYALFSREKIGLAFVEPAPNIVIYPVDTTVENVDFARRIVEENILKSLARRRPS